MWSLPPHNGFSLEKEILTHGNLEDIMPNEANQLENTYHFTYEVPRVVRLIRYKGGCQGLEGMGSYCLMGSFSFAKSSSENAM